MTNTVVLNQLHRADNRRLHASCGAGDCANLVRRSRAVCSTKMIIPLRILLLCVIVALVADVSLWGHEDTTLKLDGKKIVGLPEVYQPALLDAEEGFLQIGDKRLIFNGFMKEVFSGDRRYSTDITASWYHDPKVLPPYLSIDVTPRGANFTYSILIDLNKLKIIKAEMDLRETRKRTRIIPIDPRCWRDGECGGTITTVTL